MPLSDSHKDVNFDDSSKEKERSQAREHVHRTLEMAKFSFTTRPMMNCRRKFESGYIRTLYHLSVLHALAKSSTPLLDDFQF